MALIGPNFVFIHIPKTAGKFVREVIRRLRIPHHETGEPTTQTRKSYHDGVNEIPEEVRKGKLVFGFVRHPLTWLVSYWGWSLSRSKGKRRALGRFNKGHRDVAAMFRSSFPKYMRLVLHHCPTAPTAEMLGRLGNSRVYKYENLVPALEAVLQELGYTVPAGFVGRLPKVNVSNSRASYAAMQRALLLKKNADLCARFGYE